jgi:hypothetical protein
VLELPHEQGEVEGPGQPGPEGPALGGQGHHGLPELLHPQRRPDLHPHHRWALSRVGEQVSYSRRDNHGVGRAGENGFPTPLEPHGPAHHLETPFLHRVHVSSWDAAVGGDHELHRQQFAAGAGGGLAEMNRSPLTGLSSTCPGNAIALPPSL